MEIQSGKIRRKVNKMNIPLLDLTRQYERIREEVESTILEILNSGMYILGHNVKNLETELAEYCGSKYGVGLNSGTDALKIALKAVGVGPGTDVITSAFSYFATCEVVTDLGASVVFADIERDTYNIDPVDVEKKITDKTAAIVPIHLFGLLADMGRLREIAGDIPIIEDACQAVGATGPTGKAGSVGSAAAFSFFPSKNLGAAGDGGMMTTEDKVIREEAIALRNHGTREDRYRHETFGYNSRLDEIQAAILRIKLKYLDNFNEQRRRNADIYNDAFSSVDGIETPVEPEGYSHVYHQYTIRVTNGKRDRLFEALGEDNVGRAIYYKIPLHRQPAYGDTYDNVTLPVAEKAAEEVISLPIFPELTFDEISHVIKTTIRAIS